MHGLGPCGEGSIPSTETKFYYSPIAQLVERLTVNQNVRGSSPRRGANLCFVSSVVERPPYKWDVGSSKLSQGTMVI